MRAGFVFSLLEETNGVAIAPTPNYDQASTQTSTIARPKVSRFSAGRPRRNSTMTMVMGSRPSEPRLIKIALAELGDPDADRRDRIRPLGQSLLTAQTASARHIWLSGATARPLCTAGVPRWTVLVEFTPHAGEEMLRDGNWAADWTPAEAVAG